MRFNESAATTFAVVRLRTAKHLVIISFLAIGLGLNSPISAAEIGTMTNQPSRDAAVVVGLGSAFRNVACMDLRLAAQRFAPSGKLESMLKSPLYREFSDSWNYFFAGSFMLAGHMRSDRTLLAFYNPYFDSALYTIWVANSNKPHIEDAWLSINPASAANPFESRLLTNTTNDMPDPWAASGKQRAFEEWFQKVCPPFSGARPVVGPSETSRSNAISLLEERLFTAQYHLAALERLSRLNLQSPWDAFEKNFRAGDTNALKQMVTTTNMTSSSEILLSIPANLRAGFNVGFPVIGPERMLLFAWNVNAPALVVVSEYRHDPTWRLDDVVVLALRRPE
jgi:hypothetical protein